jgi:hypothetical protein
MRRGNDPVQTADNSALMRHALAPKTCKIRMWTGLAFVSKDWSTH